MTEWSVAHCITPGYINYKLIQRVHEFCVDNISQSVTPLWENYSPVNLDIENHLIFSVLQQKNTIVAFAGIYNGGRYPDGVYRILNRKFTNPAFRRTGLFSVRSKWRTMRLVHDQLEEVMDHLDWVFISFDSNKNRSYPQFVVKQIPGLPLERWQFPTCLYKVAPGDDPRAFQKICWFDVTGRYDQPPILALRS